MISATQQLVENFVPRHCIFIRWHILLDLSIQRYKIIPNSIDGSKYLFNIKKKKLDDIQSYLLPELIAYDTKNTTEEYAKCVNGIGITMFTDADGKKWYFDSVLSE